MKPESAAASDADALSDRPSELSIMEVNRHLSSNKLSCDEQKIQKQFLHLCF